MLSNSWIIIKKDTQKAIMETWNKDSLKYLKSDYEAVPTHEYLYKLNKKIKSLPEV